MNSVEERGERESDRWPAGNRQRRACGRTQRAFVDAP